MPRSRFVDVLVVVTVVLRPYLVPFLGARVSHPDKCHLHLRFLRDTLERVIQPVGVCRENEQAQAAY